MADPRPDAPAFLERARFEATRYGSDPWVFVRELIQNARDAGAHTVDLTAEERDGVAHVRCRDDGHGMTFAHAQAYLFRLYASSKDRRGGHAGRFGVGFWSILRFDPARIAIRSWPRSGEPWQVVLDGSLAQAERWRPPNAERSGTEIVLERDAGDGALARRIADAAFQSARFLTRRGNPDRPLTVAVNGRPINARFDLPPPSVRFGRAGSRGVVGLGPQPRVELFSKGLRVRSAIALQDLFSPSAVGDHTRVRFPELAEATAPQALLEGADLDLLLARSDARDDRALRRLVGRAESALARLVEKQIDHARPRSWRRRLADALTNGGAVFLLAALLVSTVIVAAAWWARRPAADPSSPGDLARPAAAPVRPAGIDLSRGYRDVGGAYDGPGVDAGAVPASGFPLLYSPSRLELHLVTRLVDRLDIEGRPMDQAAGGLTGYPAPRCRAGCVDFSLLVDAGPGPLRLPVPTGHRVDPDGVRVGGQPAVLMASAADEPTIVLDGAFRGVVLYRTGPAAGPPAPLPGPLPELPPEAAALSARLRSRPVDERVESATLWVRRVVAYSTADSVAAAHRSARAGGQDFVSRSLTVGAGDCDVQNGVLLLLLQASGVPARLAIGHLGRRGVVVPGLHAWVEYRDGSGPWRIADASLPIERPALPAPSHPSHPAADRPGEDATSTAPAPRSPAAEPAPAPRDTVTAPASVGLLALVAGGSVAPVVALVLVLRNRRRLTLRLDPRHDVVGLLRGALQHPEAFRDVPAVFHRRLVPRLDAEPTSLAVAWTAAATGRLYCSWTRTPLARRAADHRALVLDGRREEARVVASALGAVDLDSWDGTLARSRTSRLLEQVNAHLHRCGETWSVRLARATASPPAILDWPARRPGAAREPRGRVVTVLDETLPWVTDILAAATRRPAGAALALVDRVLDVVELPDIRRAALLAPLARAAMEETAG